MTKFALTTALTLAAAVLAATPAFAGTAQLRTADIDLASPTGKAELAKRIHSVARDYCKNQRDTGSNLPSAACIAGVKQELSQKVAALNASPRMAASH